MVKLLGTFSSTIIFDTISLSAPNVKSSPSQPARTLKIPISLVVQTKVYRPLSSVMTVDRISHSVWLVILIITSTPFLTGWIVPFIVKLDPTATLASDTLMVIRLVAGRILYELCRGDEKGIGLIVLFNN